MVNTQQLPSLLELVASVRLHVVLKMLAIIAAMEQKAVTKHFGKPGIFKQISNVTIHQYLLRHYLFVAFTESWQALISSMGTRIKERGVPGIVLTSTCYSG